MDENTQGTDMNTDAGTQAPAEETSTEETTSTEGTEQAPAEGGESTGM